MGEAPDHAGAVGSAGDLFLNVPKSMYSTGGPYLNPGPTNPSQYFIQ